MTLNKNLTQGTSARLSAIIIAFVLLSSCKTQQKMTDISGKYYVNDIPETSSVLQFKTDGTFEFFFSQGGTDRTGAGTWKSEDGQIVLNSKGTREPDFKLMKSAKNGGDSVTIKVTDRNTMILGYVGCALATPTDTIPGQTNEEGIATFPKQAFNNILLIHFIWPNPPTVITPPRPDDNYFEFTINPKIADVRFENLTLKVTDKGLVGPHPLMPQDQQFTYEKEQQ